MKNKRNTYILLVLVILIWGTVIHQFFSYAIPEGAQSVELVPKFKPLVFKSKDTSSISVAYRDPFLGKIYNGNLHDSVKKKKKKKKNSKSMSVSADEIIWPNIVYKGVVSDTKDKHVVYMLVIDGKTFLMRKGSVEDGVLLKGGDRTSVFVKYEGKLNVILIQE